MHNHVSKTSHYGWLYVSRCVLQIIVIWQQLGCMRCMVECTPITYFKLLVVHVRLCSSLAYFMMIQSLPIASKLPTKTLVARQLSTNLYIITLCFIIHIIMLNDNNNIFYVQIYIIIIVSLRQCHAGFYVNDIACRLWRWLSLWQWWMHFVDIRSV